MTYVREKLGRNLWVVGVAGLVFGALGAMASGTLGGAVGLVPPEQAAPPPAPGYPADYYEISVDGLPFSNTDFVGVSGIVSSTEGDRTAFAPVRILRRFAGPDELTRWWERVALGQRPEPRNVKITYYDAKLRPIETVVLEQAWPSGWETAPMDVLGQEPGAESIRLTFLRAAYR